MINILLADDHKMFTEGVHTLLQKESDIKVLGEANDGQQLLELLQTHNRNVDLVVLDIEMPNLNGIEVAKIIRKDYPQTRILILTYHNESDYIYNLHRMGVDGYVLKNKSGENLVGAIKDIVQYRNRPFPPMQQWAKASQPWTDEDIRLTKREKDVLQIADMTSQEIANQLGIGKTAVYTHLENMRKKFKVDTTNKLVRKAIRLGFIEA